MEPEHNKNLLLNTKKLIAKNRSGYTGGKRPSFTPQIWSNIKALLEHFPMRELGSKLSISVSSINKAKNMGNKKNKRELSLMKTIVGADNKPQFVEVKTIGLDQGFSSRAKFLMELKTQSGTTITIFG